MKKIIALVLILLFVIAVSGCITLGKPTTIKSEEEASGAITDVGSDIEKISSDIEGVETGLK